MNGRFSLAGAEGTGEQPVEDMAEASAAAEPAAPEGVAQFEAKAPAEAEDAPPAPAAAPEVDASPDPASEPAPQSKSNILAMVAQGKISVDKALELLSSQ